MKRCIFWILALSTISFSSLYQRFNNSNQYYDEIKKDTKINVDERLYGYYINADLLSNEQRKKEKRYILKNKPNINIFLATVPKTGKIYNLNEVIQIFLEQNKNSKDSLLAYITEAFIQKNYLEQLNKIYKYPKINKYIYDRLNYKYSEILKYKIDEQMKYLILKSMQNEIIEKTGTGKFEDLSNFIDFTTKYIDYFNLEDKKTLFTILVELENALGIISKFEKKFLKYVIQIDKLTSKLMKEKNIRLLDINYKIKNKQFIELRR